MSLKTFHYGMYTKQNNIIAWHDTHQNCRGKKKNLITHKMSNIKMSEKCFTYIKPKFIPEILRWKFSFKKSKKVNYTVSRPRKFLEFFLCFSVVSSYTPKSIPFAMSR